MSFLEKQNVDLLWDILLDAESAFIMKNNGRYKEPIQKNFITIVKNFYEQEKRSQQSLMELNKKIVSILIHSWIPMLKREEEEQQQNEKREKKKDKEKEKEPILFTVEEIQNNRKTQFEKELSEKESDFRNAMTQSTPPVIDFHEKKDEPISEMEKLIAETIAQRNFEINQIQNVNKEEAEKWLQPTKTKEEVKENTNTKKLIKIGEPLLSESSSIEFAKKQLSWAPQLENENSPINSEVEIDSIFKKLKPSIKNSDNAEINNKLDSLLDKMDILIELLSKKES